MRYPIGVPLVLAAGLLACEGNALRTLELPDGPEVALVAPSAGRSLGQVASDPTPEPAARAPQGVAVPDQLPPVTNGGMLIRTVRAALEVDSLDAAVEAARVLAAARGGYVANSVVHSRDSRHRAATLELRLPSLELDRAVVGLRPIGRIQLLEISSEDVGEAYVDVQARIANARNLEDRLLRLMAARTGKLEEVLQAERELARVREQIERLEGRRRYLETHTSMNTLTLTLREPAPPLEDRWAALMGGAFRRAWQRFWDFAALLVESLGIVIPLAALALGGWAAARRLGWRRRLPAPAAP